MPFIKQYIYGLVIAVVLSGFNRLNAQQTPYLERMVTVNANHMEVADLFKIISRQTSVIFSYTKPFNDKQKLTVNFNKKPLRLAMSEILKASGCSYKLKDKYIIIKCANKPTPTSSVIKGYLYNAGDSSAIQEASIYIRQTKHSAISNTYGFFSLSYSNSLPTISVSFAKEHYKDTVVVVYNQIKKEMVLYLYPIASQKDSIPPIIAEQPIDSLPAIKKDTVVMAQSNPGKFWEKFQRFNTNFRNISDTLFSTVSLSLVPYISTNRLLSINTVNSLSFNILAGYSKGVNAFELGGLLNIDNGNVQYAQLAGLGNIVSGHFKGGQIAGLFNVNSQKTQGAQMAGILNINKGMTKGFQIAGIGNLNSATTQGVQIGGVFSTSLHKALGVQFSGIYNNTPLLKGAQVAGLVNHTDTLNGLQFAGLINSTEQNNGIQIAGLMNTSKVMKGIQLAFMNFADTASGIPIGFFSYVKKGYHKVEIASDELLYGTVSFGTGVSRYYSIFIAGINYGNTKLWTYGYGIGKNIPLKKKWDMTINLSAQQLQLSGEAFSSNQLYKCFVGLEYALRSKFSLGLGPTLNVLANDMADLHYRDTYSKTPYTTLYHETMSQTSIQMWVGGKIFLKFF